MCEYQHPSHEFLLMLLMSYPRDFQRTKEYVFWPLRDTGYLGGPLSRSPPDQCSGVAYAGSPHIAWRTHGRLYINLATRCVLLVVVKLPQHLSDPFVSASSIKLLCLASLQ